MPGRSLPTSLNIEGFLLTKLPLQTSVSISCLLTLFKQGEFSSYGPFLEILRSPFTSWQLYLISSTPHYVQGRGRVICQCWPKLQIARPSIDKGYLIALLWYRHQPDSSLESEWTVFRRRDDTGTLQHGNVGHSTNTGQWIASLVTFKSVWQ